MWIWILLRWIKNERKNNDWFLVKKLRITTKGIIIELNVWKVKNR